MTQDEIEKYSDKLNQIFKEMNKELSGSGFQLEYDVKVYTENGLFLYQHNSLEKSLKRMQDFQ